MLQKVPNEIAVVGIDIGKNSFHLIGLDKRGAIVLRQKWSRGQVEVRLANLSPCLIGMEACVGAHHLSRKLQALGQDGWQLDTQEARSLTHRHPALQQESAHLIDDAGALANQPFAHTVQGLQVELFDSLGGDELHGRALHRLVWTNVFRRHQPGVVAKCLQLATEMMGADAGLHAD